MKSLSYVALVLGTPLVCVNGESFTALAIAATGWFLFSAGIYGLYKSNQSK